MKIIDVEKWSRRGAYENFINYSDPTFSMGTRLDATQLVEFCKREGKSFYSTFMYIVTKCMNRIPEMRLRIEDGKVVEHDAVHPGYVVLREDDSIVSCTTMFDENFDRFYANMRADMEKAAPPTAEKPFNVDTRTDYIYVSCMPWVDLVHVSNPYNLTDASQTSIPRIVWGKYVKNAAGRYEMSFFFSAHHALMDGIHSARLVESLNRALGDVEAFLKE